MSTKYETSKIDNKQYCVANGQFSRHLKAHNHSRQSYYETYITGFTPLCDCGKSRTFYAKNLSYAKTCGHHACVNKEQSKSKQNWTNKQRQNFIDNKAKTLATKPKEFWEESVKKAQKTQIEKYGKLASQTNEQKEKARRTKLEKYGDPTYNNAAKSAEANRSKSLKEQEVINQKRRETNLERFGVENTFMKPGVKSKSARSNSLGKEFVMPSGRTVRVRGHEDIVLEKLLEIYSETEILLDDTKVNYSLPVFEYVNVERQHWKYYPDFYIPSENKIIEVKSRWWWDAKGDPRYAGRLENNKRKWKAVTEQGYNYELWLFDSKDKYEIKHKI
jgi:hypothetical protein